MSENSKLWVSVETSTGMFSSEYAVSMRTAAGENISFFVDKALVKKTTQGSTLEVTVVSTNPSEHTQRVLLPTEAFETSSRWVDLPKK